MDRSEILQMMAALQLSGMRAAYDEIVTTGIKRKHSVDQIIAALLKRDPLMQGYRAFFASLNWSIVEQWQAQPRACGTPGHPISAYLRVLTEIT